MRVRVSHSGKHCRYGFPDAPWNDLGYVQTFTVYATGEVYVDYTLLASRDIPLGHFNLIVQSTGDWGNDALATAPGEAHCVGEYSLTQPYGATASPFAMVSSNGSRYYADMLMAMYDGIYNGSYWNEGYPGLDFRCGLALGEHVPQCHDSDGSHSHPHPDADRRGHERCGERDEGRRRLPESGRRLRRPPGSRGPDRPGRPRRRRVQRGRGSLRGAPAGLAGRRVRSPRRSRRPRLQDPRLGRGKSAEHPGRRRPLRRRVPSSVRPSAGRT